MHGGKRRGRRERQADALQGREVPPDHPGVHAPGRRPHPGRRQRWREHLRALLRGRVAGRGARQAPEGRAAVHGQLGPGHERLAVLPHLRQGEVAGRAPCGVRAGHEGHGAPALDRDALRDVHRPAPTERHHHGLRRNQGEEHVTRRRTRRGREQALG